MSCHCSDELEEHSCAGHLVELFLDELVDDLLLRLCTSCHCHPLRWNEE